MDLQSKTLSGVEVPVHGNAPRLPDADLTFYPRFFTESESRLFFSQLRDTMEWKQEVITLFGRQIPSPRLSAWYGDAGACYRYSGLTLIAKPWSSVLREIKQSVETTTGAPLNGVLLNYYRDQNDSMGWHSDDETELGKNPTIASVSFGATRMFQLQHKRRRDQRAALELSDGSLLIMRGPTQHHWRHRIPRSTQAVGERINLTFRFTSRTV
jgi:alkylated DNA repair dioxygenase AlkB